MVIRRPAMLPRNTLGRTGIEVALLGLGAEAIGRKGRSFEDAERTLNSVLEMGINLIDTASAYGQAEEFIGRALGTPPNSPHSPHSPRRDFVIVTKCGFTGDWQPAWKPAEITATVDQSLKHLQVETIDVLLLHSCELEMLQRGEVIEALKRARDAGKAKWIGYSGDNDALRYAIEAGFCDVIECSFNMLDQANAPMIETASKNNIGVLIKRTIANGVPGATEKPKSDYAAQYWPRWEQIGLKPADVDEIPWLEAAMRFSAYWPGVTCALIGSSNSDHMRLNAQWLENGPLPASVTKRVREAFLKVGKDWPGLG